MKIQLSSVMADDQGKSLAFYIDVVGFVTQQDIPAAFDEPRGNLIQIHQAG